jgi:hypothetical protein
VAIAGPTSWTNFTNSRRFHFESGDSSAFACSPLTVSSSSRSGIIVP